MRARTRRRPLRWCAYERVSRARPIDWSDVRHAPIGGPRIVRQPPGFRVPANAFAAPGRAWHRRPPIHGAARAEHSRDGLAVREARRAHRLAGVRPSLSVERTRAPRCVTERTVRRRRTIGENGPMAGGETDRGLKVMKISRLPGCPERPDPARLAQFRIREKVPRPIVNLCAAPRRLPSRGPRVPLTLLAERARGSTRPPSAIAMPAPQRRGGSSGRRRARQRRSLRSVGLLDAVAVRALVCARTDTGR